MNLGKIRKAGVGLVAAAALAGGTAVAGAGVAAADPPDVSVSQEANDGQTDVTVETEDGNDGVSVCVPVLVDGATGLNILVDYNNDDYAGIVDELASGDGVRFGEAASHNNVEIPIIGDVGLPNPSETTWEDVDNGVYVLVGVCANPGLNDIPDIVSDLLDGNPGALLSTVTDDITVQPVIVPDGIGSLAPASAFGSLLLESGDALSALSSDGLLGGLS